MQAFNELGTFDVLTRELVGSWERETIFPYVTLFEETRFT